MRLQAVARDAEDNGAGCSEFRVEITEVLALRGTAGGAVLGVEVDDDDFAGLFGEPEGRAAGSGDAEVGDLGIEHGYASMLLDEAIVVNGHSGGQVAKLHAMRTIAVLFASVSLLAACGQAWNDPYPAADAGRNILYTAFTDRPKHLDPAQSYAEDEAAFTAQIYEPPLQYHYLKRPYQLVPATVEAVPVPRYLDAKGRELTHDAPAERIAESVYELKLKPGIRFQPHPAFAKDGYGEPGIPAKIEIA